MKRIKKARWSGRLSVAQVPPGAGITLDGLRLFLHAARSGNFTQAAEASFLSQSAFSRQIQALERAVGLPLFDRVGRRARLNQAGRELEKRAAEIVARVDRLPADLSPAGAGLRGTIRLGANMSIGIRLLPNWLAQFGREHPHIYVTLLIRGLGELPPLLRGETIDASIQEEPDDDQRLGPPPLKVHFGYPDELWVVGPRGADPARKPGPEARWFGNLGVLRRRQLAQSGYVVGDTTQVPSMDVALKLVESGMGYSVLPGIMARASWKAGKLTRMKGNLTRRVTFVTLDQRSIPPVVGRLMEFLKPRWQAEAERQKRESL